MTDTYTVRYEWDERGIKAAMRMQDLPQSSLLRVHPHDVAASLQALARRLGCSEVRECYDYTGRSQIAFIWRRDGTREESI